MPSTGRVQITPSPELEGKLEVPTSKSHSMRALLLSSVAEGSSKVTGLLDSPDVCAMKRACDVLRARLHGEEVAEVIDAGNSGQVVRFVGAMAALSPGITRLTGDASIQTRRPMQPLFDGLQQLGASGSASVGIFTIRGGLRPGSAALDGRDSQPVSALLMATALLEGMTELHVQNAGEKPWIGLTLDWMARLGHQITHHNFEHYVIKGKGRHKGFTYHVPGDWSSAAYPIAAALVTGSTLTVDNLDPHDIQGDRQIVDVLRGMGAEIEIDERSLTVYPSLLTGCEVDVNPLIDALPILAVIGCFAEGETRLTNAAIARKKESDRLAAITAELRKMGADIDERPDSLTIRPRRLAGALLESHHDHRVALSLAVAALAAKGPSIINGTDCIAKSFPEFVSKMQQIGAWIEHV